jgi:hypothetical protein
VSPNLVKRMIELARVRGVLEDATVRQAIADLHSRMQIIIWSAQRAQVADGGRNGVEGSLAKVAMTQALLRCRELGCRILGADAQLWGREASTTWLLRELVGILAGAAIYGGTDYPAQYRRRHGLGLPRARPSRQTPFKDLPPTPPADRRDGRRIRSQKASSSGSLASLVGQGCWRGRPVLWASSRGS